MGTSFPESSGRVLGWTRPGLKGREGLSRGWSEHGAAGRSAAPGKGIAQSSPNGAKGASFPKIAFVIFNAVAVQEGAKLLLKIHLCMMLKLPLNIPNDLVGGRMRNGKGGVAFLPCEIR